MNKQAYLNEVLDGYHARNLQQFLGDPQQLIEVYKKHFPTPDEFAQAAQQRVANYVPGTGQVVDAGMVEGMSGTNR